MGQIAKAKKAMLKGQFDQAIRLLRPLADRDDPEAQLLIGYTYYAGGSIEAETALEWIRRAADQDHPEACYYLACWSEENLLGPPAGAQKRELLLRAAVLGSAEAQRDLGSYHGSGEGGFPRNANTARYWYAQAAVQDHADAQYNLGWMCLLGEGGPADVNQALIWFEAAAGQKTGDPASVTAARLLTDIYEAGLHGVKPDPAAARHWRARAKKSETLLGGMFPGWFFKD